MNPGVIVNVLYQLLGFYGNWGGKGWSGGTHDPDNIDWNKDGINPLDRTFDIVVCHCAIGVRLNNLSWILFPFRTQGR